jgi:hypothetical protein
MSNRACSRPCDHPSPTDPFDKSSQHASVPRQAGRPPNPFDSPPRANPGRLISIRQAWPHRPYSTRPTATRHAPSTFRSHNAPVLSWPIRRFEPTRANSTSRVSPDPFDIPSHALPGRLAEPARSQSPSTRRAGPAPFDTPSLYPSYSTRPAVADLLDIPRLSQSLSTFPPVPPPFDNPYLASPI